MDHAISLGQTVPVNDTLFADVAEWELSNVLVTGNHRFFGLSMSQHPQAVIKLNQILNATRPARIVEIGTGNAGLTVLFALYCLTSMDQSPCILRTYDKTPARHVALLNQIYPEGFRHADALEDPVVIDEIRALVAMSGRTLLIADCGKALEFNEYVPYLKAGDIVMMHDFSPTAETFEREMKGKIWNWHEVWYDRVAKTCCNHNIIHTSYTNDVAWSLGYKIR